MKLDKNALLIGGLVLVGGYIALNMFAPTMLEDLKYGISKAFNPNTPLPPDVKAIKDSQYAGYY